VLSGALAEVLALAMRLGPEAMHHLMRDLLMLAQEAVQRYEGTLLQVSDEGFLALFGAPLAQEDHARRAVLAALRGGCYPPCGDPAPAAGHTRHPALQGEVWDKALLYYRQAGATAEARSACREAVAYFEQALSALQHLPASCDTIEQAIDLRFDLRNALLELGDHKPILEHLRHAETLAQALGDQRRLGWVLAYMSRHLGTIEGFDRTIGLGECALAIAGDVGDVSL
jgi:tetratricopeptide (TPR) repeat protein